MVRCSASFCVPVLGGDDFVELFLSKPPHAGHHLLYRESDQRTLWYRQRVELGDDRRDQANLSVKTTVYQSYFVTGPIPANAPAKAPATRREIDTFWFAWSQAVGPSGRAAILQRRRGDWYGHTQLAGRSDSASPPVHPQSYVERLGLAGYGNSRRGNLPGYWRRLHWRGIGNFAIVSPGKLYHVRTCW